MAEIAINVPFDSNEIKDIACSEFRKRLDILGPLQGAKEYASFDVVFQATIKLRSIGNTTNPKETLAWGSVGKGPISVDQDEEMACVNSSFTSGDPNEERMERGMLMTVEATDGKGGKTSKRVRIDP
jgi:hypothetical protein